MLKLMEEILAVQEGRQKDFDESKKKKIKISDRNFECDPVEVCWMKAQHAGINRTMPLDEILRVEKLHSARVCDEYFADNDLLRQWPPSN